MQPTEIQRNQPGNVFKLNKKRTNVYHSEPHPYTIKCFLIKPHVQSQFKQQELHCIDTYMQQTEKQSNQTGNVFKQNHREPTLQYKTSVLLNFWLSKFTGTSANNRPLAHRTLAS